MISQVVGIVQQELGHDISGLLRLAVQLYGLVEEDSMVIPIYLTRLTNLLHVQDIHVFCIMALHIWHKLVHDTFVSNAQAATFFGYTLEQFNKAEIFAAQLIAYQTFISEEQFDAFKSNNCVVSECVCCKRMRV